MYSSAGSGSVIAIERFVEKMMEYIVKTGCDKKTFQQGINAAAQLLIDTAKDFDEISDRISKKNSLTQVEKIEMRILQEKSRLLMGQAMHIQNLH